MVENSILRDNARGQLGRKIFGEVWLMMLLACFIVAAIEGVAGITYVGTIVIAGPLSYGLCRVLVKRVRNEGKVELDDLFDGFKEAFTDSLLLGLLQGIFIFLWSLLLVIPGIIKSYSYAMSSFIQQDSRNKNWRDCLDASCDMMDGYKMQLFLLDLSFLGWYIVGALCLGVGTLFVIPYHQMARANFYMALVAERGVSFDAPAPAGGFTGQNPQETPFAGEPSAPAGEAPENAPVYPAQNEEAPAGPVEEAPAAPAAPAENTDSPASDQGEEKTDR